MYHVFPNQMALMSAQHILMYVPTAGHGTQVVHNVQ